MVMPGFFVFCSGLMSYCCVWWILSGIVSTSLEKTELVAFLFSLHFMCDICHSSFALPLDVIGRHCSMITVLLRHLLFYLFSRIQQLSEQMLCNIFKIEGEQVCL